MLNPSSVLLIYLSLTTITFVISRLDNSQMICTDKPNGLISELQKMKLKSAQLGIHLLFHSPIVSYLIYFYNFQPHFYCRVLCNLIKVLNQFYVWVP